MMSRFDRYRWATLLVIAFSWSYTGSVSAEEYLMESQQQRDARMQWWRDARFGMFIHYGVCSELGGEYKGSRTDRIGNDRLGTWIKAWAGIPSEEYDKLLKGFYPVHYNPEKWVLLAKEAGMKYVVITAKHHDGFCLFDSDVTEYDVVDGTPYGKDLIAPLAEACKKHDVRLCIYYSILDWNHPSQAADPKKLDDTYHGLKWTIMAPGKKAEYAQYMKAQLKELITTYDPGVLWFDGAWCKWWTEEDGKDLYEYCRSIKPDLIINHRISDKARLPKDSDKRYAGDFYTPEQYIPDAGVSGVDWESCMTMNDTWAYKFFDHRWKSTETMLNHLVGSSSKGGNYLLNVGPAPDGRIPDESILRLKEIGRWMKINGESIYATSPSPFKKTPWGYSTKKENKIYLHVFEWPSAKKEIEVPRLDEKFQRAYFLADPSHPLLLKEKNESIVIKLPDNAPGKIDTVIVLEMEDAK